MVGSVVLHDYLDRSVALFGERTAVEEADGSAISFAELGALSDAVCDHLSAVGVVPGDRVGVWMRKSIDAVASIFGILKSGAAYVPVDPGAPAARNGYIFADCGIRAAFVEERFADALRGELLASRQDPALMVLEAVGGGAGLRRLLGPGASDRQPYLSRKSGAHPGPEDLAYILYTSGSTGRPKGVMLSHRNATSFIDWCSATFEPGEKDRFSAHAPFHFDLSILDIYLSIKHGAALVVIDEDLGKDPSRLARFIADARISSWYSAPSILSLLVERGNLREHDYNQLRRVLFAGEVFPVVRLNKLRESWPHPRYFNLYGPTETNVCTYLELPERIESSRVDPYPIGKVCSHFSGMVLGADAEPAPDGSEGELCIAGEGVMLGYWGQPEQTAAVFHETGEGRRWYRTGDVVALDEDGNYRFLGRRDRMIKKRGYRVELDEIEACLYRNPEVGEAAVVASPHEELGQLVKAHLAIRGAERMSIIKLKRFCSERLPVYMIPDQFVFHPALPKTSTGKTDYQKLKEVG